MNYKGNSISERKKQRGKTKQKFMGHDDHLSTERETGREIEGTREKER